MYYICQERGYLNYNRKQVYYKDDYLDKDVYKIIHNGRLGRDMDMVFILYMMRGYERRDMEQDMGKRNDS